MKRLIPLVAIATLATASVAANAQGLYGEVGYTPLKLEGNVSGLGVTSKPSNLRGIIGYELNDNLAVESMLSLGLRDSAVPLGDDALIRAGVGEQRREAHGARQ